MWDTKRSGVIVLVVFATVFGAVPGSLHAPGEAHPFAIAEEEIEHYGADAGEIVLEGEEPG